MKPFDPIIFRAQMLDVALQILPLPICGGTERKALDGAPGFFYRSQPDP